MPYTNETLDLTIAYEFWRAAGRATVVLMHGWPDVHCRDRGTV